mmetsp:Transcript_1985/g.5822  ORF Transcript_1985/g.5822 Transcript_1985/m.5822 type:complete len:493 (+) Transcript_1985:743-2221(+)
MLQVSRPNLQQGTAGWSCDHLPPMQRSKPPGSAGGSAGSCAAQLGALRLPRCSRQRQRDVLRRKRRAHQPGSFTCMAHSEGADAACSAETPPEADAGGMEVDLPDTTAELEANLQAYQPAARELEQEGTTDGSSRHSLSPVADPEGRLDGTPTSSSVSCMEKGVQAEPEEHFRQALQAVPAMQQQQHLAEPFGGISPTMVLLTLVLSTFTALGASMFAMLRVMTPALRSTEKAADAMELASRDLQKAAQGMEETAQMFQREIPEMVSSIESTSKEFETLGRTLNGVSGGWRKSDSRSKQSSSNTASSNGAAKTGISIRNERVKPSKAGVQASVGVDSDPEGNAGRTSSLGNHIEQQAAEAVSDVVRDVEDAWYSGAVSNLMGLGNTMQGAVRKTVTGLVERFDSAKKEEAARLSRVDDARSWISKWRKRNGIKVDQAHVKPSVQPTQEGAQAAAADAETKRASLEEGVSGHLLTAGRARPIATRHAGPVSKG